MADAVLRFFDDLDEEVDRIKLERIAEALRAFFVYVEEEKVEQLTDLKVDHIELFLTDVMPLKMDAGKDRQHLWHGIKRFIAWCGRRQYANELAEAFGKRKKDLRWIVLGR